MLLAGLSHKSFSHKAASKCRVWGNPRGVADAWQSMMPQRLPAAQNSTNQAIRPTSFYKHLLALQIIRAYRAAIPRHEGVGRDPPQEPEQLIFWFHIPHTAATSSLLLSDNDARRIQLQHLIPQIELVIIQISVLLRAHLSL